MTKSVQKIQKICPGCNKKYYVYPCQIRTNQRKHCSANCYRVAKTVEFPERFFSLVEIPKNSDSCWIWKGHKTPGGYGKIKSQGKNWSAHRYSYIFHYGHVEQKFFICHSCDNPICVNPKHLFKATPKENTQDMYKKCRQKRPEKYKRLCKDQIIEIRNLIQQKIKSVEIAKKYDVSVITISRIKCNKTWATV